MFSSLFDVIMETMKEYYNINDCVMPVLSPLEVVKTVSFLTFLLYLYCVFYYQ